MSEWAEYDDLPDSLKDRAAEAWIAAYREFWESPPTVRKALSLDRLVDAHLRTAGFEVRRPVTA